jgi:excisionase family DNA binding protein
VPTTRAAEPPPPKNEAIGVLTLKEAATRLGISTGELEAMVIGGRVKSLMAGWTVVVPSSEVERLRGETKN